jgi:hypothetical protein
VTKQIVTFAIFPKLLKIIDLFDACASRHIKYNIYILAGRKKMVIVTSQPPFRGNEPPVPVKSEVFGRQSRSTQVRLQYQLCLSPNMCQERDRPVNYVVFCVPVLCSSFCLSIHSPFALNFIQASRISVYLRVR